MGDFCPLEVRVDPMLWALPLDLGCSLLYVESHGFLTIPTNLIHLQLAALCINHQILLLLFLQYFGNYGQILIF